MTRRAPSKSSGANSRMASFSLPRGGALHELGRDLGRHHGDRRAGALQQRDFAQRHFAAADDEHFLAGEIEENRKIVHWKILGATFDQRFGRARPALAAGMQAALARIAAFPPPAARAFVFARLHRARAGRATDARKAAVMQGVVGQPLLADVLPDLVFRPFEQRAHLVQAVFAVPFHGRRQRAAGRLSPPDAGDPGAAAGDGAAEGFHLADPAAAAALVQTVAEAVDAVLAHPALQVRGLGVVDGQGPPIALLYALDEIVGLGVQPPGIDAEYLDFRR